MANREVLDNGHVPETGTQGYTTPPDMAFEPIVEIAQLAADDDSQGRSRADGRSLQTPPQQQAGPPDRAPGQRGAPRDVFEREPL